MKFICPICNSPFEIDESGTAKCKNHHSFDRSREGYYNLLIGSSGGTHGDNREMLLARRRFLDTDAYLPLASELAELLFAHTENGADILDMGCGEGYYTRIVSEKNTESSVAAFDISKDAVKLAAKRAKLASFAVASSYKIPLESESFDAVYNVFSPLALDEVRRVLKQGGTFVAVIPDEEHLFELKAKVYDKPYKNAPETEELPGFSLLERRTLAYDKSFSGDEVRDLFMMTPYAYRTSARERARLSEISELCVGMRFIILVYRKL